MRRRWILVLACVLMVVATAELVYDLVQGRSVEIRNPAMLVVGVTLFIRELRRPTQFAGPAAAPTAREAPRSSD